MLICLAGLRSIPGYIYEAATIDRASPWRQFWTITLPMVLPFLMLAVLFRGIENFKMFDLVVELTSGGPGSTTELASINLKREAFEKWRTGYASAFAMILFVTVFGLAIDLREGAEPGEGAMSAYSVIEPSPRQKWLAGSLVVLYALITILPLVWIFMTGFKSPPDSIAYPPKLVFEPTLEGYVNLFTTRSRQTQEYMDSLGAAADLVRGDRAVARHGDRRPVEVRRALHELGDRRLRLDLPVGLPRHAGGLRLQPLQGAAEGRPAVLRALDPDDAADRGRDPDLPDVPDPRPLATRTSG